eukprot:2725913-Rhodomonas_salina.1
MSPPPSAWARRVALTVRTNAPGPNHWHDPQSGNITSRAPVQRRTSQVHCRVPLAVTCIAAPAVTRGPGPRSSQPALLAGLLHAGHLAPPACVRTAHGIADALCGDDTRSCSFAFVCCSFRACHTTPNVNPAAPKSPESRHSYP